MATLTRVKQEGKRSRKVITEDPNLPRTSYSIGVDAPLRFTLSVHSIEGKSEEEVRYYLSFSEEEIRLLLERMQTALNRLDRYPNA
jgi:hypothetical protein